MATDMQATLPVTDHERGGSEPRIPLTSTATTPVTFVCRVESGALEPQAVRLTESVRQWGGSFATCPILAVTPRRGAPLSRETREALQRLDVIYIREHVPEPYVWYKDLTKLNALWLAEQYAATDMIVWLDTDTLLLEEAPGFRLPDGEMFGACAATSRGATTGPGDPNELWWAAMCEAVGLSLNDLPWVATVDDGKRVRLYFNSGVFAYRRSTGLRRHFHECVRRVLDARVISRHSGVRFVEQCALSLAIVRLGLPYQVWPEPYNFNVGDGLEDDYRAESIREAHVLHYHDYMRPDAWPRLMGMLQAARPNVAEWLSCHGPVHEPRLGGPRDLVHSAFKAYRKLRMTLYERARARRL